MACTVTLAQTEESMRNWVLIETASTVNVFCKHEFVRDIKKTIPLVVHTNTGPFTVQEKAKLPWCNMDVWFDPNTIT
jgi:hypothetical protein